MSFNNKKFFRLDVGMQEQSINRIWNYRNEDDTISDIEASGYFSDDHGVQVNDLIYAVGSDDKSLLAVDSLNPITTSVFDGGSGGGELPDESVTTSKLADQAVSATKLANNAAETNKIADGAVTKAKLNADVATVVGIESHTLAVAATDTVTVTGAATSDFAIAMLTESGQGIDHGIVGAKVTAADTVTLYSEGTFEAIGCSVMVVRPAS